MKKGTSRDEIVDGMKKLRSCPFCGDFPIIRQHEDGDYPSYDFSVDCDCGIDTICFDTIEEAVVFWNNRVGEKFRDSSEIFIERE